MLPQVAQPTADLRRRAHMMKWLSQRIYAAAWNIGPYEAVPEVMLRGMAGNQRIDLTWAVNLPLPVTSTWQISYYGQTVPITINSIVSPTRAYSLTNLTNYAWYTVTLNAMLDSTPLLTDSIVLIPTDRLVYLLILMLK
jgi:hypothetical protein